MVWGGCGDEEPPRCGDGEVDIAQGESCDDGNGVDGDGCDSNCTASACGNGVVAADEICDDGNDVDGDGCDSNCTPSACGNGVMTMNEGCDDGNDVDGDGCDSNCMTTGCGNGVVAGTETCDDGNELSGDGCDNNCTATACGNGVMTEGEACDDGNDVDGDGCDTNCTVSGCGNGVVGLDEQCDDSNLVDGDGCDSNCTYTSCGNGIQTGNEACDDGNTVSSDGCSASCRTEIVEIEPNEDGTPQPGGHEFEGNDFAIANADANGAYTEVVGIYASLDPAGDEDVFKFTNPGPDAQYITFETWNVDPAAMLGVGVPCGSNTIDTIINIRDAAGTLLAQNDDRSSSPHERCSVVTYGLLPGQTVYVHVTEWEDSDAITRYALVATWADVPCGNGALEIGEQCDDGNTDDGDGCSATCKLEGSIFETEPNEDGSPSTGGTGIDGNDFATANADIIGAITGDTLIVGSINPAGDEDVFAFTNPGTATVMVQLDTWSLSPGRGVGSTCSTVIDTGLHVRDADATSLASSDNRTAADRCASLSFPLAPGETRYAHVTENGDDAPIASYALEVTYSPSE